MNIQSNRSITPLRQRMIEDMRLRKLAEQTQSGYLRWVKHSSPRRARTPCLVCRPYGANTTGEVKFV